MHFSLAFILFIRIFGFVNESNKQIDTFSQLRLPLIVLITFAHSYSGVRAGWTLWDGGWDSYEMLKLVVSETLVKVAMPTFFVMSGYLFFVNDILEQAAKEGKDTVNTLYYMEQRNGGQTQDIQPQLFH